MDIYPNFKSKERKGMKSALHPDIILKNQLNLEEKEKMKFTPECVFCDYKPPPKKNNKKSKNKKKKK